MKKILLIDDDEDLTDTIKSILEYAGYRVLLSHNAQQGIDIAEKQKPDLILMDVMMPGMDGAEAAKILQSKSTVRDIPIIFLTGLISDADNPLEDALNVDGFQYQTMAKPFENDKLLEVIKLVLKLE